uniref:N-terminal Ras-GEF domain-containing protein n=1 Tax=Oryctolagus cuniculus TaxID=9986 RepID=A0A5F9C1R5_RABIT
MATTEPGTPVTRHPQCGAGDPASSVGQRPSSRYVLELSLAVSRPRPGPAPGCGYSPELQTLGQPSPTAALAILSEGSQGDLSQPGQDPWADLPSDPPGWPCIHLGWCEGVVWGGSGPWEGTGGGMGTWWSHDNCRRVGAEHQGQDYNHPPCSPQNDSDLATSQDDTSRVGAMVAGRLEGEPSPKAADSASLEPDPAEAAAAEMGPGSMLQSEEPAAQAPVLSLLAASSMGTLDTAMVEKLVMELVPAQQRGDPFIVPTFLCNYRRFTTTQQVLNLLFHRYAYFQPHCEEDDRTKDALCSILGTWLENYPDDFYEFQDLARLKQLVAYVRLHMPFSDLARQAQLLLTELEDAEPKELVAEPEAFGLPAVDLEAPRCPEYELESGPAEEPDVTPVNSWSAAHNMGTLDPAMVQRLVNELVPAQERGDPFIVPNFLRVYRSFATTQQVLHLLFHRYGYFQPGCEEDDRAKHALCSILEIWLENYPEDFHGFQDLTCLHQLVAYVRLHMPFSDLAHRAQLLLTELEDAEPKELVAEPEETSLPWAAFLLAPEALESPEYPACELGSGPLQEPDFTPVLSVSAASNVETLDTAMVENLVDELVPALQRGDPFIVPTFLHIYRGFITTQQVLHMLFHRYAYFRSDCEEDNCAKDALCFLLGSWLEKYPEDFSDLACLHQLVAYVQLHMPFSDLACRAQLLLMQLEDTEPTELLAEPEETSLPWAVPLPAALIFEAPEYPAAGPGSGPLQEPDVTSELSLLAASNVETLDTAMVENLVDELVPALQRGDPFIVPTFLHTYRGFITTQQVLHTLFHRYAYFRSDCEEDDRAKHALCSILGTWLDSFPEDFQDRASLKLLVTYVQLHMPFSDLARQAQLLLIQLEDPEPKEAEAEPEAPAPGGDEEVPPAAAAAFLGSDLVPTIALQPEPDEACLSLAIVPAVDSLEPPACPEAKQEPDRPQPWFTKLCWPWGRRRGQCVIPSQDRPRRRSPSWVRTLLSCFPIRSSGPHSGPSHE